VISLAAQLELGAGRQAVVGDEVLGADHTKQSGTDGQLFPRGGIQRGAGALAGDVQRVVGHSRIALDGGHGRGGEQLLIVAELADLRIAETE